MLSNGTTFYGYPLEHFVGDDCPSGLLIKLACGLCNQILRDPLQCQKGCTFCRNCIGQRLRRLEGLCPRCEIPVTLDTLGKNKTASDIINGLRVYCTSKLSTVDSCEWVGAFQELEQHIAVCEFQLIRCSNEGCKSMFKRRERAAHEISCQFKLIKCEYCLKIFKMTEILEHTTTCTENPTVVIDCPYRGKGCNVTCSCQRMDMQKHVRDPDVCLATIKFLEDKNSKLEAELLVLRAQLYQAHVTNESELDARTGSELVASTSLSSKSSNSLKRKLPADTSHSKSAMAEIATHEIENPEVMIRQRDSSDSSRSQLLQQQSLIPPSQDISTRLGLLNQPLQHDSNRTLQSLSGVSLSSDSEASSAVIACPSGGGGIRTDSDNIQNDQPILRVFPIKADYGKRPRGALIACCERCRGKYFILGWPKLFVSDSIEIPTSAAHKSSSGGEVFTRSRTSVGPDGDVMAQEIGGPQTLLKGSDRRVSAGTGTKDGVWWCRACISSSGAAVVGRRVSDWWVCTKRAYGGIVKKYDATKAEHCIEYDDGEDGWYRLTQEPILFAPSGSTDSNWVGGLTEGQLRQPRYAYGLSKKWDTLNLFFNGKMEKPCLYSVSQDEFIIISCSQELNFSRLLGPSKMSPLTLRTLMRCTCVRTQELVFALVQFADTDISKRIGKSITTTDSSLNVGTGPGVHTTDMKGYDWPDSILETIKSPKMPQWCKDAETARARLTGRHLLKEQEYRQAYFDALIIHHPS